MNGTSTQNDRENGRWCDICAQTGRKVKLQYFQINYEDAILICPVKECTYPLNSKPLDNIIVKRKPEDIVNSIKRKRRKIDHNQPSKEIQSFISKNSVTNSELVCENSSLRSCALASLTAKIMGNICQNSAASFLSLPAYNSFLSKMSSCGLSSVFNSKDSSQASVAARSSFLPDTGSLSTTNVKSQDLVSGAYICDHSANTSSSFLVEGLSSLVLPESLRTNVLPSGSLVPSEQSEVNATSPSLLGYELKTKRLVAAPELMDSDAHHHHAAASDGHVVVLSPAEASMGLNSVNSVALDPKNQAKDLTNLAEQNSAIPVEPLSRVSEKLDAFNGFKTDSVDLSKQIPPISLKQESLNPDTSDTFSLAKPDATYIIKQNSLLDSEKHSKEYHFVKEEVKCRAEKGSDRNESKSAPSKEVYLKFLQWINKDSLCWLDAVMCLLTHCKTLRLWLSKAKTGASLKPLIGSFDIAQRLFRQGLELRRCVVLCRMGRTVKLETSVGDVMVKTGGGNSSDILFGARAIATIAMDEVEGCNIEEPFDVRNIFSREDPNTVSIEKMLQEADRLDSLSKKTLSDARDSIFASLEPSLHCKKGQNDSPLMALMELLAKDPAGERVKLHYRWTLNCSVCKATHQDGVSKEVVTFLKLPENFSVTKPCFLRKCFSCKAPDQLLSIEFERLPDLFFHHFIEGIRHCNVADLDFEFRGDKYAVTGLVQYKINPDHFVSWLREPIVDYWMECDDLKNCICKYSDSHPTIPTSQVHIVMWEKQSRNSGYRLPCERESFKQVGRVQQTVAVQVLSNQFPPPVMTSLSASLPAATVLRRSSVGQNGTAISASFQVTPLKNQDENSLKLSRKTADSTRLQRMKQKFELDRKRSSSLNSSKPVIPRIPVGNSVVGEEPNKKTVLSLPGKMDLCGERYSPSKMTGCVFPKKVSRTSVQSVVHESSTAKSNVRAGRHNIASLQTRSLLKVGRQSYLETVLPLIKGNKQSTSAVQKFDAYVPKSQKVTSSSSVNGPATSPQGIAGLDTKTRKTRVCFSESNLQDVKQHQSPEKVISGLSLNQLPTKGGILTKPVMPKSTSQLALTEPKFGFDDVDFDFSNFMDLDKILFEGNNSKLAENTWNITTGVFPMLQNKSGNASDRTSATVGCSTSGLISTNGNSFDVLSIMPENHSGFESKVFEEALGVAVHGSLPNLGDFIPPENWTSSHSGFSDRNINSDCPTSVVMNSSSSNNNTLGNYLNSYTNGAYGYSGISDNGVTDTLPALPFMNGSAEDSANLPLPFQSFPFSEEDWSWFS